MNYWLDRELPLGLNAVIFALSVREYGDVGLPLYHWDFKYISLATALGLIVALTLLLVLVMGILYQTTFRNPVVVRLTANPSALREVELSDLGETVRVLLRASLGSVERTISAVNLDAVLAGNRVRDALLGWADLSASKNESRLDRIVVYASIDQEGFTLAELLTTLEGAGYAADPESIKSSLARLELAFVLGRRGNEYAYQVPLQRELIRADDTRQLLRTEIRAASA